MTLAPSPRNQSLDQLYGVAMPPFERYDKWEVHNRPRSLAVVDPNGAPELIQFLDHILKGWNAGRVLTDDITFLWLIDIKGRLLVAIEELVVNGTPIGMPKSNRLAATHFQAKLGHPALLDRRALGRIGGELYFDPDELPSPWVINNRSRRYGGASLGRRKAHLDNVALRFQSQGIVVTPRFRAE